MSIFKASSRLSPSDLRTQEWARLNGLGMRPLSHSLWGFFNQLTGPNVLMKTLKPRKGVSSAQFDQWFRAGGTGGTGGWVDHIELFSKNRKPWAFASSPYIWNYANPEERYAKLHAQAQNVADVLRLSLTVFETQTTLYVPGLSVTFLLHMPGTTFITLPADSSVSNKEGL